MATVRHETFGPGDSPPRSRVIASADVALSPDEDVARRVAARLDGALAANAAFLALASPSGAEVAAQVRALTRQVSALIRYARSQYDSGTDI